MVGEGMREGRGRGGYNNRVLIDGNESNSMFSTTETDCVVCVCVCMCMCVSLCMNGVCVGLFSVLRFLSISDFMRAVKNLFRISFQNIHLMNKSLLLPNKKGDKISYKSLIYIHIYSYQTKA